jgi:hypothetical protein
MLSAAGISFTSVGKIEYCCGTFAFYRGHDDMGTIRPRLMEMVRTVKPRRILTNCGHCFNAMVDLAERVRKLREITGGVPIAIKIAGGHVEDDLAIATAAGPDVLVVDGGEGGTGAAPVIAKNHAGLPLVYTLSRALAWLKNHDLRDKFTLIAAGGLKGPADFAKVLAMGAEKGHYSAAEGIPELREAVAGFNKRHFGLDVDPGRIVIGPGTKDLIFTIFSMIKGAVIIPTPSWIGYYPQLRLMIFGTPTALDNPFCPIPFMWPRSPAMRSC